MNVRSLLAGVAGIGVFALWMSMVGNPHVVETVLGLVLGGATFFFLRRWLGRNARN